MWKAEGERYRYWVLGMRGERTGGEINKEEGTKRQIRK
jgi:hypothetical protein